MYDVDNTKELKHLSLCTGYGGIDIGLSRALGAVRNVAYVEIEAFVIENLVSKIEGGWLDPAPVYTNLKTFPFSAFRGRVDILSGGFPCQPFSGAGRRGGDEDPRHLWPYIVRGIRDMGRPPIVFFENVEGIISSKLKSDEWADPEGTPVLLHVLRELERLGYDATAGVFSAREIGAPHRRKRVFILGVRSDLGESGRALVSGMLERGRGEDVGNPPRGESACRERRSHTRSARETKKKHRPILLSREPSIRTTYPAPRGEDVEHTASEGLEGCRSEQGDERLFAKPPESSTAYPAPRGAEQYAWEPPRVTVGDSKCLYVQNSINIKSCFDPPNRSRETSLYRYAVLNGYSPRGTAYPAPRGADQHAWEPPRVTVGNTDGGEQRPLEREPRILQETRENRETSGSKRTSDHLFTAAEETQGQAKPALGRGVDGASRWMDYAKLCRSVDNRTDELRMLGNGVVPGTAERAFIELWSALNVGCAESSEHV